LSRESLESWRAASCSGFELGPDLVFLDRDSPTHTVAGRVHRVQGLVPPAVAEGSIAQTSHGVLVKEQDEGRRNSQRTSTGTQLLATFAQSTNASDALGAYAGLIRGLKRSRSMLANDFRRPISVGP
jgi:hypothetical protein